MRRFLFIFLLISKIVLMLSSLLLDDFVLFNSSLEIHHVNHLGLVIVTSMSGDENLVHMIMNKFG